MRRPGRRLLFTVAFFSAVWQAATAYWDFFYVSIAMGIPHVAVACLLVWIGTRALRPLPAPPVPPAPPPPDDPQAFVLADPAAHALVIGAAVDIGAEGDFYIHFNDCSVVSEAPPPDAEERALDLFWKYATTVQLVDLYTHGWFEVMSDQGNAYLVTPSHYYGIVSLNRPCGELTGVRWCGYPSGELPVFDRLLALKLLIESDEREFRIVANCARGAGGDPVVILSPHAQHRDSLAKSCADFRHTPAFELLAKRFESIGRELRLGEAPPAIWDATRELRYAPVSRLTGFAPD